MLNPEIARAKSIPEALITAANVFGDRDSMRFKISPEDKYSGAYSFKDLARLSQVIATSLVKIFGLAPGQTVGFISENRQEYNLGDAGTLFAGGIAWGLYDYDLKTTEIVEYKLNDSGTEIIFTSPTFLDSIRRIYASGNTPLKKIVVMDMNTEGVKCGGNETPFSELLKSDIDAELIEKRLANVNRDTVARLIYTSGTTGRPKGVMLSHGNLLCNVESSSKMMSIDPGERLLSYLPEAHSFQGFITLAALLNGAAIWYSHKKTILSDMQIARPTLLPGVPMVFKRFAEGMRAKVLGITRGFIDLSADYSKKPAREFIRRKVMGPLILKKTGLDELFRAVSGSAKLEQEHARTLRNIGMIVLEGYGISETSPVISCERHSTRRPGSVGLPIPDVDVKILSLTEGPDGKRTFLQPGEKGEIICSGPNVFKGYFNDPEKTKKSIINGYYHTGDLGHFDEDGFLFVHGRCGLQVKMSNGEFVDLDVLAADILRHTTLIQSAAVDAEQKEFSVAVVSLAWEPEAIEEAAKQIGVELNGDIKEFARNEKVIAAIKKELDDNAAFFGDPRSPSVPRKFLIVSPMSPETGDITSTMKFRVRQILEKYRPQIEELRKSDEKYLIYIK